MAKRPVAIKCRSEFRERLIAQFPRVEIESTRKSETITGFPFSSSLYGIDVIVDDSIDDDYEVQYVDVPSADEIMAAFETLKRAGLK
jgi:hypothetical protein